MSCIARTFMIDTLRTRGLHEIAEELMRMEQQIKDAQTELERAQKRLLDYDDQFSQIATTVGGDAGDCPNPPRTLARFVKIQFEKLNALLSNHRARIAYYERNR